MHTQKCWMQTANYFLYGFAPIKCLSVCQRDVRETKRKTEKWENSLSCIYPRNLQTFLKWTRQICSQAHNYNEQQNHFFK